MKKKILFLIVVLASRGLAGQTFSPNVIPSTGAYGNAAGYSYSSTIGESNIQYLQSGAAFEQGFQHGELDITTGTISPGSFCAGATVTVPFTATGIFNTDNIFTAQLSDALGNFSSAVNIGTLAGTTSGSISATIPSNIVAGTGYRIKVTGSDIQLNGTDNGSDITVNSVPTAPTASAASILLTTSFTANWDASSGATGYNIDVSTVSNFSSFVSGLDNLNVNNVLTYNITGLSSGTQYYYQVRAYNGSCTSPNSNSINLITNSGTAGLWVGNTADWNTPSNWSDGNVPISTTNVVIPSSAPNQPVISSGETGACANLTINAKASLSVTGTGILNSEGNLLILSDATGTGAFTQGDDATVSITGSATVQRYLESTGYHYIASPLTGIQCNQISGFTMTHNGAGTWYDPNKPGALSPYPNMWRIDEQHTHSLCPADYDSWFAPAGNENMTAGVGYAINTSGGTISVSKAGSALNAGTYTASVSNEVASTDTGHNDECLDLYGIINGAGCVNVGTGPSNGWHLIGNPYPSPVDWKALVNGGGIGANITPGISFFKPTTQYTGIYGTYFYNGTATSTSGAFNPGQYIPAMQSFFIQNSVISSPLLTFKNSFRSVLNSALNSNYYKAEEDSYNSLQSISLQGFKTENLTGFQNLLGLKDKTVIMFGAQSTDIGMGKLMNTDENVPNIYSISNNQNLSINLESANLLSSNLIIPLGFDVNTSGDYTINASQIINFPSGTHIYLEDLTHNVLQDLTANPNYTFAINKGDAGNRFFLKFNLQSDNLKSVIELFDAYSVENTLIVNYNNPDNLEATLSIYNILGQNVKELRMENGELRINLGITQGAYMVRLVTNDRVYIKKVYLQ